MSQIQVYWVNENGPDFSNHQGFSGDTAVLKIQELKLLLDEYDLNDCTAQQFIDQIRHVVEKVAAK